MRVGISQGKETEGVRGVAQIAHPADSASRIPRHHRGTDVLAQVKDRLFGLRDHPLQLDFEVADFTNRQVAMGARYIGLVIESPVGNPKHRYVLLYRPWKLRICRYVI